MPVVQTFEKNLDTEERLAALAAAMNRLPANAVVRRLSNPGAAPAPASAATPASASAPVGVTTDVADVTADAHADAAPADSALADQPAAAAAPHAATAPGSSLATPSSPTPAGTPAPSPGTLGPAAPAPGSPSSPTPAGTPAPSSGTTTPDPGSATFGTAALDSNPGSATFGTAALDSNPGTTTPDTASRGLALFESAPLKAAPSSTAAPNATTFPTPDPDAVAIADPNAVPVPEPLVGLLPGGLRRGEAAALATRNQGPDYLALALLAEALKAGLWCAVIGVPELGLAALAGLLGSGVQRQAALDRLILVAEPGEQWAEITATLADGVDLLLARPGTPVRAETAQRVDARLRQGRSAGTRHSAALLVLGGWPTARLALRIARMDWTGLDGIGPTAGTGHLTAGRATVVAQGRATAGRPRVARVWLPDATGAVRSLSDDPRTTSDRPSQTGRNIPAAQVLAAAVPTLTLMPHVAAASAPSPSSSAAEGTSPASAPASPAA